MSRSIFKESIDYGRVRVHDEGFLWFGLQPRGTAMAPNGELWFNRPDFRDDFSQESDRSRRWFMHEMVHVWQYQLGYSVKLRGAIWIGLAYDYRLAADRRLGDYNMEAQGDLLADYFALKFLQAPEVMAQSDDAGCLDLYEQVLVDFLADPGHPSHLP